MSELHVLPMRFRINLEALAALPVYAFPMPQAAVEIRNELRERGESSAINLPIRQLGRLIRLLYPALIGTFYENRSAGGEKIAPALALERNGYPPRPADEHMSKEIAPALALDRDGYPLRPTAQEMRTTLEEWFKLWLPTVRIKTKDREIALGEGEQRQYRERFREALSSADWQPVTLDNNNIYRILPSLLSVLLVERIGNGVRFDSLDDVRWQLAQFKLDRGLDVVSAVQTNRQRKADFAYKLVFHPVTYAGQSKPEYVHLSLECQRYPTVKDGNRSVWLNNGRNATVLIRLEESMAESLALYLLKNTFVPLSLGYGGNAGIIWMDGLPELIEAFSLKQLVEPSDLLKAPQKYRGDAVADGSSRSAEYRLIYAEGMTPNHPLETGVSMGARRDAMQLIADHLREYLTPDEPIEVNRRLFNKKLPMLLRFKKDTPQRNSKALRYALKLGEGEAAHVLICYQNEPTKQKLLKALKANFGEDSSALKIHECAVTESALYDPLPNPRGMRARKDRYEAWVKWLKGQLGRYGLNAEQPRIFALIESPTDNNGAVSDSALKGIIRAACYQVGIASQFILSVPPDGSEDAEHRAQKAVVDLLLRQSGLTYAAEVQPSDLYACAVATNDAHRNLEVVGIYRHRSSKAGIDLPMAVRILPSGHVEARLLDESSWQPYFHAVLSLGKKLIEGAFPKHNYQTRRAMLLDFLKGILTEKSPSHRLILLNRIDWRSEWSQLKNPEMRYNELRLEDGTVIKPGDTQKLRVVTLRTHGNNYETPQCIGLKPASGRTSDTTDETEITNLGDTIAPTFYEDKIASQGGVPTYGGIARLPKTVRRQYGGAIAQSRSEHTGAFKHQTVVYAEPIFLQARQEDKPEDWALLAHILRQVPTWDDDHTLLPFPLHVARLAFEDAQDAFEQIRGIESAEDDADSD